MVAVIGLVPALMAVNEAILPEPLAANPIDGVLLVQLYIMIPPLDGEVKLIFAVGLLLHTTWLATGLMIGGGLTVIVNVIGVPLQVTPPLV